MEWSQGSQGQECIYMGWTSAEDKNFIEPEDYRSEINTVMWHRHKRGNFNSFCKWMSYRKTVQWQAVVRFYVVTEWAMDLDLNVRGSCKCTEKLKSVMGVIRWQYNGISHKRWQMYYDRMVLYCAATIGVSQLNALRSAQNRTNVASIWRTQGSASMILRLYWLSFCRGFLSR